MTAPKYEFLVEDDSTNEVYCLDFATVDDKAKKWLSGVWQRMAMSLDKAYKIAGGQAPPWVEWKVWEWCESKKPGYEPRTMHVAWCGVVTKLQGFSTSGQDFRRSSKVGRVGFISNILELRQGISGPTFEGNAFAMLAKHCLHMRSN